MKTILLLAVLATSFYGCSKYELPGNTPECMQETIKAYDKSAAPNSDLRLEEYYFDSKVTYALIEDDGWNQFIATIYDDNCNIIEHIQYGCFSGDGDDIHFFENATYIATLWER